MTQALHPTDEAEVAAIVAEAAAAQRPLAISGGGTRASLGRPVQAAAELSARGLTGITLYEPAEMVISARAGTPLAEVEAALAEGGQRLPFEPMDHRPVFGSSGEPTIGGVAAANVSGPRRIQAGAARDSLIGVRAVNGRGEAIKSGGRVMKNVTGYDLVKVLAGSYGTLAVLTEVTFKVLPVAETETTLVLHGLDDAAAVAALSTALGSPWEVTGAAHIPDGEGGPTTLLRVEGFEASVRYRGDQLAGLLPPVAERLGPGESQQLWAAVRDLGALLAPADDILWRVSVKPTAGPEVAAAVRAAHPARILYDWGGGLVWIAIPAGTPDGGATAVRAAVGAAGGHATLVRAPAGIRAGVDVFEPPQPAILAISRGVKQSFDPFGILNPGRMYGGV